MTEYRFRIEDDYDYDPATSVDWDDESTAAYVSAFATGDLAAFGLILERKSDVCAHCKRGGEWEVADSLWGIDVSVADEFATGGAFPNDGEPVSTETATAWTSYLGECARSMFWDATTTKEN